MQNMPADVQAVVSQYPAEIRERILQLRDYIFEVISEAKIDAIKETLKWGEPSYLAQKGTTVRLSWSKKKPDEYGIYFHCQTQLIETFRAVYGDIFHYTGNRGIIFNIHSTIPEQQIKQCILVALEYHHRKHLSQLGLS